MARSGSSGRRSRYSSCIRTTSCSRRTTHTRPACHLGRRRSLNVRETTSPAPLPTCPTTLLARPCTTTQLGFTTLVRRLRSAPAVRVRPPNRCETEKERSTTMREYVPVLSTPDFVKAQVEQYERTGGKEGNTLRDTGRPIIIVTTIGAKTGAVRKI